MGMFWVFLYCFKLRKHFEIENSRPTFLFWLLFEYFLIYLLIYHLFIELFSHFYHKNIFNFCALHWGVVFSWECVCVCVCVCVHLSFLSFCDALLYAFYYMKSAIQIKFDLLIDSTRTEKVQMSV